MDGKKDSKFKKKLEIRNYKRRKICHYYYHYYHDYNYWYYYHCHHFWINGPQLTIFERKKT